MRFFPTKPLRATIAVPSVCDFYFTPHRFSSLGAHILRDLLFEQKIDVSIVTFPFHRTHGRTIDLPPELWYLKKHIASREIGKLSYFTTYRLFGPPPDECARLIVAQSPDICFISCFAFSYASPTLELARQIKKTKPLLPIVIGGAGPSAYPLYFIRDDSVDFVLANEAETSIRPFLEKFLHHAADYGGVPNCYWKINNQPQEPIVKRLTKAEDISVAVSKTIETRASVYFSSSFSRGCPKQCSFCSNFIVHGSPFRTVAVDKVQQALAALPAADLSSAKNRFIIFEDDNLLLDQAYCFKLMRLFKKKFKQASFLFENGIDYTLLSPGLVDLLVKEGLSKFNLSIVSVDTKIAQKENRALDIDHYEKVVGAIASHHVPCITYFICGFKNDTRESIAETLAFLHAQPTLIGISLFYAVPGITNFERLDRFDSLPPFLCNGSSAYPWNGSLSTETMITAFRLSRYCNLVKQEIKSAPEMEAVRTIHETKRLFTFMKTKRGVEIIPVEHYDVELTELFFQRLSSFAP
jgi:anaerobic magnesium-protoporphyrin IX monomethyl ester cyclase